MRKSYSPLLAKAWYIAKYGKGLKMLTPKQILKGLPVALAQVKAGNIWKRNKWNLSNNTFFVLSKRNY